MITTSGKAVDRVMNRRIAGVVPVGKQMYTCMSLLAAGVDRTGYAQQIRDRDWQVPPERNQPSMAQ